MQQKNKNAKFNGLLSGIFSRVDQLALNASDFSLDMTDACHAVIRGCRNIAYYSPNVISLRLKIGYINICGKNLFCSTFSSTDVCVEGKIKVIFFSETSPRGGCGK